MAGKEVKTDKGRKGRKIAIGGDVVNHHVKKKQFGPSIYLLVHRQLSCFLGDNNTFGTKGRGGDFIDKLTLLIASLALKRTHSVCNFIYVGKLDIYGSCYSTI